MIHPIQPRPDLLPFEDRSGLFTWDTFERFVCAFLNTGLTLRTKDGSLARITFAHRAGGQGHEQQGVDIVAQMSNGETWVLQCKHVKDWGPSHTRDAIAACKHPAARKFLLVTKTEVSPATRAEIETFPDWEFWSGADISRHFLNPDFLPPAQASRLLFTYFGPGWSKAMLGLPDHGSLQAPEARFADLLKNTARLSFRTTLFGRDRELAALDAFIESKKHRALFLTGPGGQGKSRLLRAWTTSFSARHPDWHVRFVLPHRDAFAEAIKAERRPLLLILDDAHDCDDQRRALFTDLVHAHESGQIKVLLCLRPGPQTTIITELRKAGFDTLSALADDPVTLGPLTLEDSKRLVDEVTQGHPPTPAQRTLLARISRECPLIADIAGHLIVSGKLAAKDIRDDPKFRAEVFDHLLDSAKQIEAEWERYRIRTLLGAIALLSPVNDDDEFRERAARLLGQNTTPRQIGEMLSALITVGLVTRTHHALTHLPFLRVTPDLLSDHLAYTACYDRFRADGEAPRDKGFVKELLEIFSYENFPRLLRHLAMAEWRAGTEADSVVEPVWQAFLHHYDASPNIYREEQLKRWSGIAHLQPHRTLLLAEHVLRHRDAPPIPGFPKGEFDHLNSPQDVIGRLPALLQPVAEQSIEHTEAALDLLWRLAREETPRDHTLDTSPLDAMAGVLTHRPWKSPEVHRKAVAWLDRFIRTDKWLGASSPHAVLVDLLRPLFATESEEDLWESETTLLVTHHAVPLSATADIRETARALCQHLLARRDRRLAFSVLRILDEALRPAHVRLANASRAYLDAWDRERAKALDLVTELLSAFPDPAIHFSAGRRLRDSLRFLRETETYLTAARAVLESISDRLDLRVARICLGYPESDIVETHHNDHAQAEAAWKRFTEETADALLHETPEPLRLLERLEHDRADWESLGLNPNFRPLISAIGTLRPPLAISTTEHLLNHPAHSFAIHFDAWTLSATANDSATRLDLLHRGLAASAATIRRASIFGLGTWRRQGGPFKTIHDLLMAVTPDTSPAIARELADYVWRNDHIANEDDWRLLATIRTDTDAALPLYVFEKASYLLQLKPPEDSTAPLLILQRIAKADTLTSVHTEYNFPTWSKHYPVDVFKLLWLRLSEGRDTPDNFQTHLHEANLTPHSAELWSDPAILASLAETEARLLGGNERPSDQRLIHFALHYAPETITERLRVLIEKADTSDAIHALAELFASDLDWPFILSQPDLCRRLLLRARALGPECHAHVRRRLATLRGSRNFADNAPDDAWRNLLRQLEMALHAHAANPELGPLYRDTLAAEQATRSGLSTHSNFGIS